MDVKVLMHEYLTSAKLMQLATQGPEGLWMCHVWFAHSADLTRLVFTSNRSRRHSKEIDDSGHVSGGVVAIDLDGLGQKVRGLVFSGSAYQASGNESDDAYSLYSLKWPVVKNMFSAADIRTCETPMRMYIVRPSRLVLWDEVNFPQTPRQEIVID